MNTDKIDDPLVTVVIATFNRAPLLATTLESVRHQEFTDFEVWVVGDGCSDDSASVVAALEDDRFKWKNLSTNHRAPHAAHNAGIEQSIGKYIAYLNHDDLWFPWHLANLVSFAEQRDLDFAYDMLALKRDDGWYCTSEIEWFPHPGATPSAWIHRRDLFGKVVWRDPYEVGLATDVDFLMRLREEKAVFGFLSELGGVMVPSHVVRTYDSVSFVQEELWESLKQAPETLAKELLIKAVANQSSALHRFLYPTFRLASDRLWKSLSYRLLTALTGKPVFPLQFLQRWYFTRNRARDNVRRGLGF